MIKWPDEVIEEIARRRAVLFLGAGISMNAQSVSGKRPPSWDQFLKDAVSKCKGTRREMEQHLRKGDLLTCCQLIKYRLGKEWVSFLERQFFEPKFLAHSIHENIFKLDSSIVITPNVDRIYDTYAVANGQVRIKKYYDEDIGRTLRGNASQRLILKLHGCIDTPGRLIFTREDYADIRARYGNVYRAVDALIMTHTFVFLGCGLSDPDVALVLEQYARSFTDSPPHFFVTAAKLTADYEKMIEKNYNLKAITYSPKNDHKELTESLADLVSLVEDRRDLLSKSMLW